MKVRQKIIIQKGTTYHNLEIIKEVEGRLQPSGQRQRTFLCLCLKCGNTKSIRLSHLKNGRTKTCGCSTKNANGESQTPIYLRWKTIKQRCSSTHHERHLYFDNNIKVCDEWNNDFYAFKKWALANGFKRELSIDRIDNRLGYSPSNCRFVNNIENANNKRNNRVVSYKGIEVPISMLIREKFGEKSHYETILCRMNRGWSVEDAIDTPIRVGKYLRGIGCRDK